MKIFVKVKPNSKENKVVPPENKLFLISDVKDFYVVHVKESPVGGKANDAVIRELAENFRCSKSQIVLKSGSTSKTKVFEINI